MAMLYTYSIGNMSQNTMVVLKMRDSVPSARYFPICNVLRQWKTSLTLFIESTDSMIHMFHERMQSGKLCNLRILILPMQFRQSGDCI